MKTKNRRGTIYLVHAQKTNRYKIGITSQPMEKYIKSLQSRSPYQLEIIHTIKVQNYHRIESELHKKFEAQKIKINGSNEWFQFNLWQINFEVKPLMNRYNQGNIWQFIPSIFELGGLAVAAYFLVLVLS